ncbi:MAG TPA: 50S ribosomal protein L3, partial [Pseudomonadales bacterium]|nr:50S ribosomal protein L3 [Pseudomonadales bacterium]
MTIGIVGVKRGMTRIFTEDGASMPVTVIEASPNRIAQRKTTDIDGYDALQVTCGEVKASRVNKPMAGHFSKANVEAGRSLYEFRCTADSELAVGDVLTVEGFEEGQKIDVTGQSKGKGFAGVVKR